MADIPVFAFAGYSGSGKTTLIEKLIKVLADGGLRVGVIKHDAHGFEIDHEGKDTWRFKRAGASVCCISGVNNTAMVKAGDESLDEIIKGVKGCDIILVEGWKNAPTRQIGIARRENGKGFTAPVDRFCAIVTDIEDIKADCPVFDPDDIGGLTEFIMKNMADFTHFDDEGKARMVNVSDKPESRRTAVAAGRVFVNEATFN
ncbi:MAG: molybdopterin-guanine dinucleotide biosynthesis protein B, partial [Clostridia bacterium]|nr:molybdopterin-guanine dinucleotide biosynthesis protein B [Clostridia bacterium]